MTGWREMRPALIQVSPRCTCPRCRALRRLGGGLRSAWVWLPELGVVVVTWCNCPDATCARMMVWAEQATLVVEG